MPNQYEFKAVRKIRVLIYLGALMLLVINTGAVANPAQDRFLCMRMCSEIMWECAERLERLGPPKIHDRNVCIDEREECEKECEYEYRGTRK